MAVRKSRPLYWERFVQKLTKTVSNKNQCLSYRIKPFPIKINVCHIE